MSIDPRLQGSVMGWNCDPSELNCRDAALLGTQLIRWSEEWAWHQPTSDPATFDTSVIAAQLATVHSYGLGASFTFQGVPSWVNASSTNTDGGRHWYPTDAAKDILAANAAVKIAKLLDPARDWFQPWNEVNNIFDFNNGDQSPARIAAAVKAVIDAVRAACPTLRILFPSFSPYGDLNATPYPYYAPPNWMNLMTSAEPTLLTTSRPTLWTAHTYVWGDGVSAPINGPAGPAGTKGWVGRQQMLAARAVLLYKGVAPENARFAITEFGEPSTPGPNWTEQWQRDHAAADHAIMDQDWKDGITAGMQIRHTLHFNASTAGGIDAGHDFGVFDQALKAKPIVADISARARSAIAGGQGGGGNLAAEFRALATNLSLACTDLSIGATAWSWNFGDGSTSNLQHPTHVYAAAGTYTVGLVVANAVTIAAVSHPVTVVAAGTGGGGTVPVFGPAPARDPQLTSVVWGDKMGVNIVAPVPADVDLVINAGLRHIRTSIDVNGDIATLKTFVDAANLHGISTTVCVSGAVRYLGWAATDFLVYGDWCKRVADLGCDAIQAGYSLMDPAQNAALAADSTHPWWELTGQLALAARAGVAPYHPSVTIVAAAVIPWPSGTPTDRQPYDAVEKIALYQGRAMTAVKIRPAFHPYELGDPRTGTLSHNVNPCAWMAFAQARQYGLSWRRPMWLTEFGWDASAMGGSPTLSQKEDQQAVQADLYHQAIQAQRVAGLRIGRLFWHTLRDTGSTDVTRQGLYRSDGSSKPVLPVMQAWAVTKW